jgi:hypothetical protein
MQSTPTKAAIVPPDGAAATSRDFSIGRSAAELLRDGRVVLGLEAFVFGIGIRSRQMFRGEVATALSSGALIVCASVSWTDGGGNGQPPQAWRRLSNRVTSRAIRPWLLAGYRHANSLQFTAVYAGSSPFKDRLGPVLCIPVNPRERP